MLTIRGEIFMSEVDWYENKTVVPFQTDVTELQGKQILL